MRYRRYSSAKAMQENPTNVEGISLIAAIFVWPEDLESTSTIPSQGSVKQSCSGEPS